MTLEPEENTAKKGQGDITSFVIARMREGADRQKISLELSKSGIDSRQADRMLDTAYRQVVQRVINEEVTGGALQTGILGGILAALAGGIVWALVSIQSGLDLGVAAWGLGFLCGWAVVKSAGSRKGIQLQFVAVACVLLAVLTGKYTIFVYYYANEMAAGWNFDVFWSAESARAFIEAVPEVVGNFNFFWILLAIASAWKIPRGLGIDLPPQYRPPFTVG